LIGLLAGLLPVVDNKKKGESMTVPKTVKTATFLIVTLFGLNFQSLYPTALIDAVISGDYNQVASLLKSRVPINEQDVHGFTAVWTATYVLRKNSEGMKILELILQYKPDLDKLSQGETPLMNAIKYFNWKAAELLIAHNPNLEKRDEKGDTALMLAYDAIKRNSGKDKDEALKIVNLLSAKMKNPEKINIPKKSCFLSFEQNDWNGAISYGLTACLSQHVISIAVPQLLKELFKRDSAIRKACTDGKITFLASKYKLADGLPQLIVIIPVSLDYLGIKIPESEKQKDEPAVDISFIETKFGFKNLTLMNPGFVADVVEKSVAVNPDEFKKILENFPNIINTDLPQHPTRFFLSGHGSVGKIAAIPIELFGIFPAILTEIGTKYIYIDSCYAVANIPQIQDELYNIIRKQLDEKEPLKQAYKQRIEEYKRLMEERMAAEPQKYPNIGTYRKSFPEPKQMYLLGIDFAIAFQAAADVTTGGVGDVKAMFVELDKFLQDPVWALEFGPGVKRPKVSISDVISALGFPDVTALPSIRMPGKSGLFRSINLQQLPLKVFRDKW